MNSSVKIMGILNVTPDSFSDGGLYNNLDSAINHAKKMIDDGADIIDIGGESSRPNAKIISIDEELNRVIPIIKSIREFSDVKISIDSHKSQVMLEATKAGVNIVNDIYAARQDNVLDTLAKLDVDICLMHMQGSPQTMQNNPQYKDVVIDVFDFLEQRVKHCLQKNIKKERLIIDVGFGFGKTQQHNIKLFTQLNKFKALKLPLLVGISRKSMIANIINEDNPKKRTTASVVAEMLAVQKGANIIRTHNVAKTKQAIKILKNLN